MGSESGIDQRRARGWESVRAQLRLGRRRRRSPELCALDGRRASSVEARKRGRAQRDVRRSAVERVGRRGLQR